MAIVNDTVKDVAVCQTQQSLQECPSAVGEPLVMQVGEAPVN